MIFNRAADSKPTVSKETSDKILNFNRGDATLFNAVNATFWQKIEKYGHQKMKNQIKKLNQMTDDVMKFCVSGIRVPLTQLIEQKTVPP